MPVGPTEPNPAGYLQKAKDAHKREMREHFQQPYESFTSRPKSTIAKITAKLSPGKPPAEGQGETLTRSDSAPEFAEPNEVFIAREKKLFDFAMRIGYKDHNQIKGILALLPNTSTADINLWRYSLEEMTQKFGVPEKNECGIMLGKSVDFPGEKMDQSLSDKQVKVWNPGHSLNVFVMVFDKSVDPAKLYENDTHLPEVVISISKLGPVQILYPHEGVLGSTGPDIKYRSLGAWRARLDTIAHKYRSSKPK